MPIVAEHYPDNWDAISWAVREEAGWRCECDGRCGQGRQHLARDGRCAVGRGDLTKGGKAVVLTVAHLNHTPQDCRRENLRAMCQACHLNYDAEHHRKTREAKRAAELAAQMAPLFELFELGEEASGS